MLKLFIVFLLFQGIVSSVFAGSEQLRVMILDDRIKKTDFPQTVRFDSKKSKMSFTRFDRLNKFRKLKLTSTVEKIKLDELDQDLLYMDLKNKSLTEIIQAHKNIPAKVLQYAKNNFNR